MSVRRRVVAMLLAAVTVLPTTALSPVPMAAGAGGGDGPSAYADPFIGSTPPGFTNPGPSRPHGMASPGPDTEGPLAYGGYYLHNRVITGFSQTHMSAGVYQGGLFPVLPLTGPVETLDPARNGYPQPVPAYSQPFDPASQVASPGYYAVTLSRGAIRAELTVTDRVALHRYRFAPGLEDARVVVDPARSLKGYRPSSATRLDARTLLLRTDQNGPDHTVWGALRFSEDPIALTTASGEPVPVGATVDRPTLVADFPPGSVLEVRVGLSFTDGPGALANLETEAPQDLAFDRVVDESRQVWDAVLRQVEVTSSLDASGLTPPTPRGDVDKVRLYTALYHARLFPSLHSDVDGRYRGLDDLVRRDPRRPRYSQFSLWDSYRGQNELLAVLDPERYEDMMRSLLEASEQQGTLPRWQLGPRDPGYMSGDPAFQFLVTGACRGVGTTEVSEDALEAILTTRARRPASLDTLGWLPTPQPANPSELVDGGGRDAGTTLEFGVADAAAAMLAHRLGHTQLADELVAASLRFRNLQDPDSGWIRPRDATGRFAGNGWAPEFGYGFQEGTSWQYSWLAMHDLAGLVEGMGGDEVVQERLDSFFALPATAVNGAAWANVQNKQTLFGIFYAGNQFAPGNEHDLHAPYTYNAVGAPWKTQAAVRTATSVYSATADGLPGNDDLGALSGWLVWSLLGLHPAIPGAPVYVVGSPTFPSAVLHTPTGDLVIEAPGASEAAKYVTAPRLGEAPLTQTWLTETAWRDAGTFHVSMSAAPDTAWGVAPDARPPTVSDGLEPFGCHLREARGT
ncbi:MAG: GH92 family glycosyl hydrolase [Actinomycetes bacterium]